MSSAVCFNLDQSKILLSGDDLNLSKWPATNLLISNDNILVRSELETFSDDNINVSENLKVALVTSIFSFHDIFIRILFRGWFKVRIVWQRVK